MHYASKAYAQTAKETSPPRQLEANLLLKAAAKLQAVHESWREKPIGLYEALTYNRKLWTVFIDAVIDDDNRLPLQVRQNIANLGIFVMGETFSLMTKPSPEHR
jgi:flagellar biosynthesis activator protein FlaF